MSDKIRITILQDGTIKTETDKISMANHANAEGFIRKMFEMAGGAVTRVKKMAGRTATIQHNAEH